MSLIITQTFFGMTPSSSKSSKNCSKSVVLRLNFESSTQKAFSAESRTGLLATTDSLTAFLRLKDFLPQSATDRLLKIFDQETAQSSGLRKLQDEHRRDWYSGDKVPTVELIQFTRGFIAPEPGASYVTLLGGIMVSRCFETRSGAHCPV